MKREFDLLGKRFGRLLVIEKASCRKHKELCWICKCDCGTTTQPITGSVLRANKSQSCGCLQKEKQSMRTTTHGLSNTRLHRIWSLMKRRCYKPSAFAYKDYGGRGITVCDEWKNSFENFYEWAINHGYSDNLTIDRIDNNKGYSPNNCRWENMERQANNRRNNVLVEIEGITKSLSQWAKETGLNYKTLYNRYTKGYRGHYLIRGIQ